MYLQTKLYFLSYIQDSEKKNQILNKKNSLVIYQDTAYETESLFSLVYKYLVLITT